MSTLRQLVVRSTELLAAHPLLWTPPLAAFLLPALLANGPAFQVPLVMFIELLVWSGWVALVAEAHRGGEVRLVTFFDAVGRSALRLFFGGAAVCLGAIALVVPGLVAVSNRVGGSDRIRTFEKPLLEFIRGLDPSKSVDPARLDPGLLEALTWLGFCAMWVLTVLSVLLLVLQWWPHAVVLENRSWFDSLARSWQLVRLQFGRVMGWLSIQTCSRSCA
jgi:hypothetical protein